MGRKRGRKSSSSKLPSKRVKRGQALYLIDWILVRASSVLPRPYHWSLAQQADDPDIREFMESWDPDESLRHSGRNATGNRLRQLVHEIEYRASLAFQRFLDEYGFIWIASHENLLVVDLDRWVTEPDFKWFGLSTVELAQVHYAKFIVMDIQEDWEDSGYQEFDWPIDETQSTTNELWLAHWLDENNDLYSERLAEFKSSLTEKGVQSFDTRMGHRTYEDATWKGDKRMLIGWGGPNILQHLPLARMGMEPHIVD